MKDDDNMDARLAMGKIIRDGVEASLNAAKVLGLTDTQKTSVIVSEMLTGFCMMMAYFDMPKDEVMRLVDSNYDAAVLKWAEHEASRSAKQ